MSRLLVMYVDCDADTLFSGVVLLRTLGHAVIATANADVAVEVFAREPVAAVVLCESIESNQRQNIAREMRTLKPMVPIMLADGKNAIAFGSPSGHDAKPLDVLLSQLLGGNAAASAEGDASM